MSDPPGIVQLRRGGLYLSSALCAKFFPGLETVILLRRDRDLLILPVRHAAAGGYLLKLRNSAGDRVVFAPDFFREHGFEDHVACEFAVDWDPEVAALTVRNAFPAN
ncbi:conserved hypothetical protein [Methylocella silvestris BL2]|uniref:Uncharacterized protein n=1 Tax=Methylocella silvestris (strain DSM 15510 / CIP 108128 / LMG 27833 / NCIMB 13906 / BL2) TaxID=395965 RepID=B8EJE9_METSB|nr:hypothetical protein [Methylocella silvestris]ACK52641.1 conserved hypothetical protein [Methylocella silvestris BL2]